MEWRLEYIICILLEASKKKMRQVNGKILKECAEIVEKVQQTSLDTYIAIYVYANTVLHEQWMCLGMQTHPHHTGNTLIPIAVPLQCKVCRSTFSFGD